MLFRKWFGTTELLLPEHFARNRPNPAALFSVGGRKEQPCSRDCRISWGSSGLPACPCCDWIDTVAVPDIALWFPERLRAGPQRWQKCPLCRNNHSLFRFYTAAMASVVVDYADIAILAEILHEWIIPFFVLGHSMRELNNSFGRYFRFWNSQGECESIEGRNDGLRLHNMLLSDLELVDYISGANRRSNSWKSRMGRLALQSLGRIWWQTESVSKSLFQRLEQMGFHIETRRIQNAGKDFWNPGW